jgi:hypothetical protein
MDNNFLLLLTSWQNLIHDRRILILKPTSKYHRRESTYHMLFLYFEKIISTYESY